MAERVGIIGLAIMGSFYAKNLIAAGFEVCASGPLSGARERLKTHDTASLFEVYAAKQAQ
ncbi:NAD binding domain of 6-phosphogluconate dehydrogenase [Octadecabacter temperatus]|uniref:6-phosphogluconate dehydrogenase NADP-binding domain-containing protein n=1 Tax=Octadecabacter temperatus TaxID=1458307 RepID=A0A0K0Y332_9RHOB|nr:NAD(P)-binding domain-containing protein [Octadecabacter temperatus]AKS45363.1 hypothetical protein OSB_08020 [Octadecabacter temperatus]SIN91333.1 NAD binding domain of 6-phosphogluconate dehydrogenase [Octadecabacter temperatus]